MAAMCSQFLIMATPQELEKAYGKSLPASPAWKAHIAPQVLTPVLTRDGVRLMRYSLLPSWAKEPQLKFSTHNARIETIESKPVWREPFRKNRCLVAMSSFIEPIYRGDHAGNMTLFNSPGLLLVAGIFDRWQNSAGDETIESFAIITREPSAALRNRGLDRQPLFLRPELAHRWIDSTEADPQKLKQLLREIVMNPTLETSNERPLKAPYKKGHHEATC